MIYFKRPNGDVFAFQSSKEKNESMFDDLVLMSDDEVSAHISLNTLGVNPSVVTRAQGKAALIRAGLWQGVIDYVASIEDSTEKALAEVALNDTTHWQRSSPFLSAAAEALGLTQEQLDELFVTASEIEL